MHRIESNAVFAARISMFPKAKRLLSVLTVDGEPMGHRG